MTPPPTRSRLLAPRRLVAVAVALLAALAGTVPAAADLEDRQRRIQERLDRLTEREGDLSAQIRSLDEQRAIVDSKVEALDDRLARLNAEIAELEVELTDAQKRLALLGQELEVILGRLVRRTDAFTERAIAAYKAGPAAYVDSLLSAETFTDLVDRYEYHESALDTDSRLLEDIQTLRLETEERRALVESNREQIAQAKLSLEADRAAIDAVRDAKAEQLAERMAVISAKEDLLSAVESEKARYLEMQEQLEREAAEIAGLVGSAGTPGAEGQLLWPAAGPVTSGYGYRTHPIFGDRRLHTGIDIGASYGAQVIASDAGVVTFAGVMSGYGNVVVVDHGDGLATTYNHLSAFSVASGESVERGAPVGSVGCTGYCTGPHLHFEVRVNGNPVDPMPYLQ